MNPNYNKRIKEDAYLPGEKEALDGLFKFEKDTVRNALEKKFPGSTRDFWMEGSPMNWKSIVPVIIDDSDKSEVIDILSKAFQVSKSSIELSGADYQKIKKDTTSISSNYTPYSTERRLLFTVDWKDTKNENLLRYKNFIQDHMKSQGIQWEKDLIESLNRSTTDALENYIYNKFLYNNYGLAKMTDNIVDIIITPDTVDIAFDFAPKEAVVMNGLSGKPSKVISPTQTEIEVTEKRIDRVMTELLMNDFFKDLKRTPFFKLIPNGHKWYDNRAFMCLYDIVQYTEKK